MIKPPINIDLNDAIRSLLHWIKGKKNKKISFSKYFIKYKRRHRLRKLTKETRKKILEYIDGKELRDGRTIVVDYKKRKMYISDLTPS